MPPVREGNAVRSSCPLKVGVDHRFHHVPVQFQGIISRGVRVPQRCQALFQGKLCGGATGYADN